MDTAASGRQGLSATINHTQSDLLTYERYVSDDDARDLILTHVDKFHLRVLGIARESTLHEARQAFQRQLLRLHPDRGGSRGSLRLVLAAYHAVVEAANKSPPQQFARLHESAADSSPLQATGCKRARDCYAANKARSRKGYSVNDALASLAAALQGSTREHRRRTLEALPARVSAELLLFMRNREERERATVGTRSLAKAAPFLRQSRRVSQCRLERVQRAVGVQYRVAECLPSHDLIIKSQYVNSLEKAVEMCQVLIEVGVWISQSAMARTSAPPVLVPTSCSLRPATTSMTPAATTTPRLHECLGSTGACGVAEYSGRFQVALLAACSASSLIPSDLRLSFRACIRPSRAWAGKIEGRCTPDLSEALLRNADSNLWPTKKQQGESTPT